MLLRDMYLRFALLLVVMLYGCATPQPTRTYEIPKGSLILTDDLTVIKNACKEASQNAMLSTVVGCYTPATQTIYCSLQDLATCGHELLHHVGLSHERFENDPPCMVADARQKNLRCP